MKEKIYLPGWAPAQARGRCCIQYTDSVTGRILEEIQGENHVFAQQIMGTQNFQDTALRADLLLTTGGFPVDDDIPVIPGDPVGFGRPGNDGAGLFRGTYRAADSYYNKRTRSMVSCKYVYDFLNTQALRTINWVGLTAGLTAGVPTAAINPPHPINIDTSSYRLVDCDTGEWYRVSGNTLYWADRFSDTSEHTADLLTLLNVPSISNTKLFYDWTNKRIYAMVYRSTYDSANRVYTYYQEVYLLAADLTGATLVCSMTVGTNWAGNGGYGGYNNGKLYWFAMNSANEYESCTLYVCDTVGGTVTASSYNANTGDEQRNCLYWDSYSTHFYKGYFWNMRAVQSYSSNGYHYNSNVDTTLMFQNTSPMYDMANERVCSTLPPSVISTESYQYGVYRHPIAAEGNQWALFYNYSDSVPTLPFALTKYQIPAGAPVRPAGAGMTVTYELEVTW